MTSAPEVIEILSDQEHNDDVLSDSTPPSTSQKPAVSSIIIIPDDNDPHESLPSSPHTDTIVRRHPDSGKYTDGRYSAATFTVLDNPSSIPYLPFSPDGALHQINGWTVAEIISDSVFSYETRSTWKASSLGFLNSGTVPTGAVFVKKRYNCAGVHVCPLMPHSTRSKRHKNVDELQLTHRHNDATDPQRSELLRVRQLYLSKFHKPTQFCRCKVIPVNSDDNTAPSLCTGHAVLRRFKDESGWFVGCSNYFNRDMKRLQRVGNYHVCHELRSYSERAIDHLAMMMEEGAVPALPHEECYFVLGKGNRVTKKCPVHDLPLEQCGKQSGSSSPCPCYVVTYELCPNRSESKEQDNFFHESPFMKKCWIMCFGEHNHPAPPQKRSTLRKRKLLSNTYDENRGARRATVVLQAQKTLLDNSNTPSHTNLLFPVHSRRTFQQSIKNGIRQAEDHYSRLSSLLRDKSFPYLRCERSFPEGLVYFMATDDMLDHACSSQIFAADATFKTMARHSEGQPGSEWNLYNIVSTIDLSATPRRTVVVARAVLTFIDHRAYQAVWEMFFQELIRVRSHRFALNEHEVTLHLPYFPKAPALQSTAITIRSITTDFEAAEIKGICTALLAYRGGSMESHVKGVMRGCSVHYNRCIQRRAATLQSNGGDANRFISLCHSLLSIRDQETADSTVSIIASLDDTWSEWLMRDTILPLICPAYSTMSDADRTLSFQSTNVVESANRSAHLFCGVNVQPVNCVRTLHDLDRVRTAIAGQFVSGFTMKTPAHSSRPSSLIKPLRCKIRKPRQQRQRMNNIQRSTRNVAEARGRKHPSSSNFEPTVPQVLDYILDIVIAQREVQNTETMKYLIQLHSNLRQCRSISEIKEVLLTGTTNLPPESSQYKSVSSILAFTSNSSTTRQKPQSHSQDVASPSNSVRTFSRFRRNEN